MISAILVLLGVTTCLIGLIANDVAQIRRYCRSTDKKEEIPKMFIEKVEDKIKPKPKCSVYNRNNDAELVLRGENETSYYD